LFWIVRTFALLERVGDQPDSAEPSGLVDVLVTVLVVVFVVVLVTVEVDVEVLVTVVVRVVVVGPPGPDGGPLPPRFSDP
jgi:hypothetical protein